MQIRSFLAGITLALMASMVPAQQANAAVMVYGTACSGIWVTDSWGNDTCVTDPYPSDGGGGGGGSTYDGGGGGGGGGSGTTTTSTTTTPPGVVSSINPPNNPNYATCKSNTGDRQAHASEDVRKNQAYLLGTKGFSGIQKSGELVQVTYDDGGTEIWMIDHPLFTDPLMPVPVTGTLKCPK
jgi:hypothetical protein